MADNERKRPTLDKCPSCGGKLNVHPTHFVHFKCGLLVEKSLVYKIEATR